MATIIIRPWQRNIGAVSKGTVIIPKRKPPPPKTPPS